MKIESINRPWLKRTNQGHFKTDRSFYQSPIWKQTVNRIWERDKSLCQLCLQQGIKHYLERGTKDLSKQGTVDHKTQRINGGSDSDDNLWLIGSNHHNVKRAEEKNKIYSK